MGVQPAEQEQGASSLGSPSVSLHLLHQPSSPIPRYPQAPGAGGSSAALAEVALSDGTGHHPHGVGWGLPTALLPLPARPGDRGDSGQGCDSSPGPACWGPVLWGEGLPWLPRVGKGGWPHWSWGRSTVSSEIWLPWSSDTEGGFPVKRLEEAGRV